jgi:hypothetical protein
VKHDGAIARIAARQHGLVTRQQALHAGLRADAIRARVHSGRWLAIRYDVYAIGGMPPTWEQAVLAAVLAFGPGAVASHATAGRQWDLPSLAGDRIELTSDRPHRIRLEGVKSHRTVAWLNIEHTTRFGIPVTSVARTLVDLSGRCTVAQLGAATEKAMREGNLRLADLRRTVAGLPPAPGRTPRKIHAVLAKRLDEYEPGESDLEMFVLRAIVSHGIPEPAQQHWVKLGTRRCRIDLAYPALKLAIEVDGWGAHRTRMAFDYDRARENDLVVAGWRVLRFTSNCDRGEIGATVASALAALGHDVAS